MPIINQNDAVEVEQRVRRIFNADSADSRMREIRGLFVELLDFDPADGEVGLQSAPNNVELPGAATRVAVLEGTNVVYIPLGTRRVRNAEASVAVQLVSQQLDGDLLAVFSNDDVSQLHLIYPSFECTRPKLRRMVVERDLPRRTSIMQLSNIYWRWRELGSLHSALESAFDVEAVTRKFFDEYKRVFGDALREITGFDTSEVERENLRQFTQTLFNRLMFVYFISRKGWLSFNGDKDYLNALWKDYQANAAEMHGEPNFRYDRLRPLFFGGLNNPSSEDPSDYPGARRLIGKVPFLNGGLFEETYLDRRSDVTVPDQVVRSIFDDLFNRFNFTVMESTPFDVEVAVDPEMLGKVFEELVTGRHDSGAYYTPRPVVSFMCREALKGYVGNRTAALSEDAIHAFVEDRDTADLSVSDAREVGRALDEVTVVDPACGSGAYLLGMMQELVELQTELYNAGLDSKSLYDLKLQIIERNLYGADMDMFAVNIAMLRLWLSLSIEYDAGDPPPLPNLDFKVVCGDSLRGPDPSPENYGDLFRHQVNSVVERLGELKRRFQNATGRDKDNLREEIEDVHSDLTDALAGSSAPENAVDWRVQFAEVFVDGEFDVAIANPPYVRQEQIKPASYKNELVRQYADAVVRRSDLYCYFYARALQLLRGGGIHIFVCSNSWLDVAFGAKLKAHLLDVGHIQTIYDSAVERQFSTAQINTLISIIQKTAAKTDLETRFISLRDEFSSAVADTSKQRVITRSRADLHADEASAGRSGAKWGGKYLRAPDIYHHILDKCADKLVRLGDIATVKRGITTGANAFFYVNQDIVDTWGIEDEYLHPIITRTGQEPSLVIDSSRLFEYAFVCRDQEEDLRDTNALCYIQHGESKRVNRVRSVASRKPWYSLPETDGPLALGCKVNHTARTLINPQGCQLDKSFYGITPNSDSGVSIESLCRAMNATSTLLMIEVYSASNLGGGLAEIAVYQTNNLMIPDPKLLSPLDADTLNGTEWDVRSPSALRRSVDADVFDVLGLTTGERDGVYDETARLVTNRLDKAKSL